MYAFIKAHNNVELNNASYNNRSLTQMVTGLYTSKLVAASLGCYTLEEL